MPTGSNCCTALSNRKEIGRRKIVYSLFILSSHSLAHVRFSLTNFFSMQWIFLVEKFDYHRAYLRYINHSAQFLISPSPIQDNIF